MFEHNLQVKRHFDRVVVHQFDPGADSPGGINSCLRGIIQYLPADQTLAIVGVDASPSLGRRLGRWYRIGGAAGRVWFMPVARFDPADQSRRIPHSVRLVLGLVRYLARVPTASIWQAHRMDVALSLWVLRRPGRTYFVHNQEGGLTGATSDSFWRILGRVQPILERWVARGATSVVVFNPSFAAELVKVNPRTRGFGTWYDPALLKPSGALSTKSANKRVIWIGRLEKPKDPLLAISTMSALSAIAPGRWSLVLVGSGTLGEAVRAEWEQLPPHVRDHVELVGRLPPGDVYAALGRSSVFMMTSHAGYEGFPRVLTEALASGLPAVVTAGSDTGGVVVSGQSGYVVGRSPTELAQAIIDADMNISARGAMEKVSHLSAPVVVQEIFEFTSTKRL